MKKTIVLFISLFSIYSMCFAHDGNGLVIAVPTPQLKSTEKSDEWIPQFMQDSLTTNFARYSKMTVIDRANENLTIAEQKISTNAQYDDGTAIEIGKMTNAKLVLAGNIQKLSSAYSVNFRVNDIETNEIKASYQNNYTLAQIESGYAVQEVSKEILLGLGIELGDKALAELGKTNDKAIVVNQNLAKGAAAEKNEDFITALSYFTKVQEDGGNETATKEARGAMDDMLTINVPTNSIKARLEYGRDQITNWNKIFADLKDLLTSDGSVIVVYDFSKIDEDIEFDYKKNSATVSFNIAPGVKVFWNRNILLVFKSVCDAWEKILADKQNDWCKEVDTFCYSYGSFFKNIFDFEIYLTLFDDYGDTISSSYISRRLELEKQKEVIAQNKYYNQVNFSSYEIRKIDAEKITDTISQKITKIARKCFSVEGWSSKTEIHPRIFTVQEYEEWLAAGCP